MRSIIQTSCFVACVLGAAALAQPVLAESSTTSTTTVITTTETHTHTQTTTAEPGAAEVKRPYKPYSSRGVGYAALMYLPNRIYDIFDILRARLRLGPGAAVGVRVTDPLKIYFGSYSSVWAGLPGPRMESKPIVPGGLESYNGVALSMAEGTFDGGMSPKYSPTEIGVSVHALIVGADVDVDPIEIVDAVLGLFFIDVRKDDL